MQPPPVVLYVRDLRGVVAAAPMPVGATAGALKRKAAEMTGVPEDEFALSSGGKLLECRARTLDELGIVSGYVIDQSGRLRGGGRRTINKANRDAYDRSAKAILGDDYDTYMRRLLKRRMKNLMTARQPKSDGASGLTNGSTADWPGMPEE